MKGMLLAGLAPLAFATAAIAQDHQGHSMAGMQMPAAPDAKPAAKAATASRPAGRAVPTDPHAGHDMAAKPAAEAAQAAQPHDIATPQAPSGTDLPPGDVPAPPPVFDRAADRYYPAAEMAAAEQGVRNEHGGGTFHQVMFDIAEYQPRPGKDGYRWEAEAWAGGDINRLWFRSEGEGRLGERVENAEIQALYSRALDPYWNLQVGVRQDLGRGPRRTYAALNIKGLAPYWFETEASLFLSNKGDLFARAEAYYDQRITQDLVLQPRTELNFALQDDPGNAIGSGLSTAEFGLRLRYEHVREFAPYVGISWERRLGRTADFARARGEDKGGAHFVLGIRTWF